MGKFEISYFFSLLIKFLFLFILNFGIFLLVWNLLDWKTIIDSRTLTRTTSLDAKIQVNHWNAVNGIEMPCTVSNCAEMSVRRSSRHFNELLGFLHWVGSFCTRVFQSLICESFQILTSHCPHLGIARKIAHVMHYVNKYSNTTHFKYIYIVRHVCVLSGNWRTYSMRIS